MKFVVAVMLITFILLVTESRGQASQPPCTNPFGKIFKLVGDTLVEINYEFGLHVTFDTECEINRLKVGPKSEFSDLYPQWKLHSPMVTISDADFEQILGKVRLGRDFGSLLNRGQTGLSGNFVNEYIDEYSDAFLLRFQSYEADCKCYRVKRFEVLYASAVNGEIRDKASGLMLVKGGRLLINDVWYWAAGQEYDRAQKGMSGRWNVVKIEQ